MHDPTHPTARAVPAWFDSTKLPPTEVVAPLRSALAEFEPIRAAVKAWVEKYWLVNVRYDEWRNATFSTHTRRRRVRVSRRVLG